MENSDQHNTTLDEEKYEEVNLITKGGKYGWPVYEGYSLYKVPVGNTSISSSSFISPILVYSHSNVNKNKPSASITGDYFYRSLTDPCMNGRYIYADLYAKYMWAVASMSQLYKLHCLFVLYFFGEVSYVIQPHYFIKNTKRSSLCRKERCKTNVTLSAWIWLDFATCQGSTLTDAGDALSAMYIPCNEYGSKLINPLQIVCGAAHTIIVAHSRYGLWASGTGRRGGLGSDNLANSYAPYNVLWLTVDKDFQDALDFAGEETSIQDEERPRLPKIDKKSSFPMEEIYLQSNFTLTERYASILHNSIMFLCDSTTGSVFVVCFFPRDP
ncbi:hypothetical protein IFM89_004709 [Coptis chinensis]|uniref:Glucose/Sorbosone dehydrogenase domain-containing protein n=1 Tax=Coptis chinensis TaxID=261450 RepID=A0A835GX31_9MAGN|nr:hypothetical protein IFM89_004709 [Coptis chinensis]